MKMNEDKSAELLPTTTKTTTTTINHHLHIHPSEQQTQHPHHDHHQPNPHSRLIVFLTVSFYLLAALVMVFVNKWVLNSIPIPTFLLFCQLTIAVILLRLTNLLGWIKLPKTHLNLNHNLWKNFFTTNHHHHHHHPTSNHHHHQQAKLLKAILPLVFINTLGLLFNTYCLKFVDASFYQVARGLILPFTVLASYIFLGTTSSSQIKLSILIVCIGFLLGVSSERMTTTISRLGVLLGIFSSMTTSIHAIVVKRTLEKIPSTITLTYYTNALSALLVAPFIFFLGEIPSIVNLFSSSSSDNHPLKTFLLGTLVTGIFGFLICIAGFLSIKVTSPVTHMISSAVRGVIQTALGAILFGDVITTGRMAGITMILIGSIYYTWTKDRELSPTHQHQQYTKCIHHDHDPRDDDEEIATEMG